MRVADRCDKCQAQAFVWVVSWTTGYDLQFCGHHFNEYWPFLDLMMFNVVEDDRDKINEKPSLSANV